MFEFLNQLTAQYFTLFNSLFPGAEFFAAPVLVFLWAFAIGILRAFVLWFTGVQEIIDNQNKIIIEIQDTNDHLELIGESIGENANMNRLRQEETNDLLRQLLWIWE